MNDAFSRCHPAVNFFFFAGSIGCAMFLTHPVFLGISLLAGAIYHGYLRKKGASKGGILWLFPTALLVALINPLFSHQGATILTYFKNGNPLTLESIVYGGIMGTLFASVILWFGCYNAVMTSDKFLALFGRVIPKLSLVLSMALRFVPKFRAQLNRITEGQRCIGRDQKSGNLLQRAKNGLRILSILITWALESGIETADSMRSRGYGLKGRSSFQLYRLDTRDRVLLGIMGGLSVVAAAGFFLGAGKVRYYPSFAVKDVGAFGIVTIFAYAAFLLVPLGLDLWEDLQWRRIQSKI